MTPTAFRRFAALKLEPVPRGRLSPKEKTTRRKDIEEMLNKWKLKVGFEFHVQIQTKHKMFSSKFSTFFTKTFSRTLYQSS
jgi:hypothetical protein